MAISWKYPISTDPPTKDAFAYKLQLHSQLFVGLPGTCQGRIQEFAKGGGRKPLSIPPSLPAPLLPLPFPLSLLSPALASPLEVGPIKPARGSGGVL